MKVFNPKKVKELRLKRRLTQQALAGLAGMSLSGLSQTESGRRPPNSSTLGKIAGALKAKIDYFFEG